MEREHRSRTLACIYTPCLVAYLNMSNSSFGLAYKPKNGCVGGYIWTSMAKKCLQRMTVVVFIKTNTVHSKIINNQSINQSIQLPSLKIEGIGYFSPSPSHRHHIAYSDWFAFSMRRQVGPDSLLSLEFISYIEPRKGEFSD